MDTLTHALSGALLARATAPRESTPGAVGMRRRIAAGALAAAFPDLDFVLGFVSPSAYLLYHRGVTHSLILLPIWAIALAWVFARLDPARPRWQAYFGVVAGSLGIHILGDLITSFGTVMIAPFSDRRFALDTTFIIDLWFSGIIVAGLVAAAVFRRSRLPAIAASVLLAGYVGFQWVQKQRAEEIGRQYAAARGLNGATVQALPRPVSPFNWTVFVSDATTHHFAHLNLVRQTPRVLQADDGFVARLDAAYLPVAEAHWETRSRYGESAQTRVLAREAWNAPALGFFRWFADKPAFDGVTHSATCVWFADLRFLTPGRSNMPFRYGVCRDGDRAAWQAFQRAGPTGRTQIERLD